MSKRSKKLVQVALGTYFRTTVRAGQASAGPPFGPQIGARGLNVAQVCKEFNERTAHIIPGVPLPTRITIKPDRSFDMVIQTPQTSWLLMRAAGIRRGSSASDEATCGYLSVKHIYEIARIKSKDEVFLGVPLEDICAQILQQAGGMGITVQPEDLNPEFLGQFFQRRRGEIDAEFDELEKNRAAKMARTL